MPRPPHCAAALSIPFSGIVVPRRTAIVPVPETEVVTIYDEPKIDCHNHLLDPAHFGYAPDAWYQPVANEQGTAHQLTELFDAYGSRHALVVGPNSGYDTDNRCLLDFLARGTGRFKGVAVVDNDISRSELERLRGLGIVGTTMQASLLGVDHFGDTTALLRDLAALDMFADVQVDGDQLIEMAPVLEPSGVRVLIDHCGRPDPTAGLSQPGFRRLLDLASSGRYFVKISGLVKCSAETYPWRDSWPFVQALLVHSRPVHVGIGLAIPASPRADRLRTRSRPCRATDTRSRRPSEGVVGHPNAALRL
jgi:predicted TIM-barrel fold metal-dependent hydrolase